MARKPKLVKMINTRVTNTFAAKLKSKLRKQGDPAKVHREILEAFVEDRLTITPKS